MEALPENKLDPRVKAVWRINDGLWIVLGALVCIGVFALISLDPEAPWAAGVTFVLCAVAAVLLVLFLAVLPPIRFARWRYQVSADYLTIARGIIWRKRFVIPFIRVQNTDTRQGPIMRAFGLASVTVATAAGEHEIPGLAMEQAEALRDKAAELARLAREDV